MASHVQRAQGQVGLFFTSWPPSETLEWFESFARPEFARMGEISTIDLTLPAGPVTNNDGKPFPHSMEPQLRKLGLAARMVAGVPSLPTEHVVCRKGDQLTSEQVRRPALVYVPILFLIEPTVLGPTIKATRGPNSHLQGRAAVYVYVGQGVRRDHRRQTVAGES